MTMEEKIRRTLSEWMGGDFSFRKIMH